MGGCADLNRMGGPRAWKEAQKKQEESRQSGWDQEQQNNDISDEEGKDVEKRDFYAEYDVDEETENEKSQREKGVGDTGEMPGQEDVRKLTHSLVLSLISGRNLPWL
jgi:Swi5-dependent recombination DNA repair protein 1